jgi:hypothetical protein
MRVPRRMALDAPQLPVQQMSADGAVLANNGLSLLLPAGSDAS